MLQCYNVTWVGITIHIIFISSTISVTAFYDYLRALDWGGLRYCSLAGRFLFFLPQDWANSTHINVSFDYWKIWFSLFNLYWGYFIMKEFLTITTENEKEFVKYHKIA